MAFKVGCSINLDHDLVRFYTHVPCHWASRSCAGGDAWRCLARQRTYETRRHDLGENNLGIILPLDSELFLM